MPRTSKRSEQEIEQMLRGYEESGLSRRQYCEQQGIAVTTFDYYRQGRRQHKKGHGSGSTTPLARVELSKQACAAKPEPHTRQASTFTLTLANGRRIESNWNCSEQELARLIRIVEAA
jgi:hypothetical protein